MKQHLLTCALALMGSAATVSAVPRIPSDESEVVERLPIELVTGRAEIARLRAQLRAEEQETVLAAARRMIELSRERSDPRLLGLATSGLQPLIERTDALAEAFILRATIRQSLHQFEPALEDLRTALTQSPRHPQAWITRASIETVLGRHQEAVESCSNLSPTVSALIRAACAAPALSMIGRADEAYSALERLTSPLPTRLPPSVASWVFTMMGEIAERLGRDDAAERGFLKALEADPSDLYALNTYSDFLLERGRDQSVVELLSKQRLNDAALVRLTRAEKKVKGAAYAAHRDTLDSQLALSRARGDSLHLREEGMFLLHVKEDVSRAHQAALENWKVQREIPDLRLLAKTSLAAGDHRTLGELREWMRNRSLQDPVVMRILAGQSIS
jgi:tetratricopeptide (TPR) repeat protein